MPKIQRFVPARSSTKRVRNTSLRLRSGVALRFRYHPLFPLYQMHSFIYFFHFISQSYRFFPGLYFCTCLFAGVSAWYAEWGTDTHLDTFTDQTPKAFGISFKALQNCWWVHVIIWTRLWDCILNNSCSSRCSVATANTALPPMLGIITSRTRLGTAGGCCCWDHLQQEDLDGPQLQQWWGAGDGGSSSAWKRANTNLKMEG